MLVCASIRIFIKHLVILLVSVNLPHSTWARFLSTSKLEIFTMLSVVISQARVKSLPSKWESYCIDQIANFLPFPTEIYTRSVKKLFFFQCRTIFNSKFQLLLLIEMDFSTVPLLALSNETKWLMSILLNPPKVLTLDNGLPRYFFYL